MKQETEDKIRKLLNLSEQVIDWARMELEGIDFCDTMLYADTIQSLNLLREIKSEMEFKRPNTQLEQLCLNF